MDLASSHYIILIAYVTSRPIICAPIVLYNRYHFVLDSGSNATICPAGSLSAIRGIHDIL